MAGLCLHHTLSRQSVYRSALFWLVVCRVTIDNVTSEPDNLWATPSPGSQGSRRPLSRRNRAPTTTTTTPHHHRAYLNLLHSHLFACAGCVGAECLALLVLHVGCTTATACLVQPGATQVRRVHSSSCRHLALHAEGPWFDSACFQLCIEWMP
jgi:hypothetical protein